MITETHITTLVSARGALYESVHEELFIGCPVSELPKLMRDAGWRNVSRDYSDRHALRDIGLRVVTARYVGGARPKRFCDVVVGKPYPFNPMFHAFMRSIDGATHQRVHACWEDTGDAENGPELTGHPDFDLYTLDGFEYMVTDDGAAFMEQIQPEPFDTQGIECDAYAR